MSRASRRNISRISIASAAARLMAQDGIEDIALAKRKAARQFGATENHALPDDAEVESELRLYLTLYQSEEQPGRLRHLREAALEAMDWLHTFRPYLTGAALDGTASGFSAVDLMLFADSGKDVEIFLLDHGMDFAAEKPRHRQAEALLRLSLPKADVNLHVFPAHMEYQRFHHRDGRERARLSAEKLRQLLKT
ncbi:MAG: hypothetical protein LBI31_01125 [Zoogloeaceae bacterium]|jgi:hypothetical protein|nr:hypothetical protein [Zoogloeaceae bacterium]